MSNNDTHARNIDHLALAFVHYIRNGNSDIIPANATVDPYNEEYVMDVTDCMASTLDSMVDALDYGVLSDSVSFKHIPASFVRLAGSDDEMFDVVRSRVVALLANA